MRLLPKKTTLFTLFLTLLTLSTLPGRAEDEGQLWSELGLRYRAFSWLRVDFDQHLRFDQDMREIQSVMPELNLKFLLHKHVRLGLGYRFIHERSKSGDFEQANRLHLDAQTRFKSSWLRLDHRLRLQETFEEEKNKSSLRNRLRLRLALWDTAEPFASAEVFNRFGDEDGFRFSKFRLTVGTSLELADHVVDLFYRYEQAIDDSDEARLHILGLGYRFDLPSHGD